MIKNRRGPMSTYTILKLAGNLPGIPGYRIRQRFDRDLDEALKKLHQKAVEEKGEEWAACLLAHLFAKAPPNIKTGSRNTGTDGSYSPRPWAKAILKRYRQAILEEFSRSVEPSGDDYYLAAGRERKYAGRRATTDD